MSGFFGNLMNQAMGAVGGQLAQQLGPHLGSLLQGEGVGQLISQADQAGLGDKIRSWIGTGENLPISADEIRSLLTNQQVQAIVDRTGLPAATILPALAQLLPATVDHATPNGTTPGGQAPQQG